MFVRIKLTTTEGREFLSPFVYVIEDGVKRLRKLGWLQIEKVVGGKKKKGKLEIIRVEEGDFPALALYNIKLDDVQVNRYIERIRQIERMWLQKEVRENAERKGKISGSEMGYRKDW